MPSRTPMSAEALARRRSHKMSGTINGVGKKTASG